MAVRLIVICQESMHTFRVMMTGIMLSPEDSLEVIR